MEFKYSAALPEISRILARFAKSDVALMGLFNLLRLGNFLLVLPLALRTLSPDEMGLWFVMLNLVFSANLIEFGLAGTVGRTASFFLGGTTSVIPDQPDQPRNPASSTGPNYAGLAGLMLSSGRIFRWIGVGALLICIASLIWLAGTQRESMLQPSALIAFAVLGSATVFNVSRQFQCTVLFGLQRVRQWQMIFFTGLIGSYALSFAGLLSGFGIVALAVGQAFMLIFVPIRCAQILRSDFPDLFRTPAQKIGREFLWSPAWRSGIITVGAWMATHATIPICASQFGLATSAGYALSFQIAMVCNSVAFTWVNAKRPQISTLFASGRIREARHLAATRIALSVFSYLFMALAVLIFTEPLLGLIGSQTSALPRQFFAVLLLACTIEFFGALHSTMLIATNSLRHYPAYIACGIIGCATALIAPDWIGLWGIVIAPAAGQFAINLWWTPPACWRRFAD